MLLEMRVQREWCVRGVAGAVGVGGGTTTHCVAPRLLAYPKASYGVPPVQGLSVP